MFSDMEIKSYIFTLRHFSVIFFILLSEILFKLFQLYKKIIEVRALKSCNCK